jgi:hypothetical protein
MFAGVSTHPAPDVSAYRRNGDFLRLLLDLKCAVRHERHDRAQRCPYWSQRSAHDADEEREFNDGMAIWMLDDDAAHTPFVDESLDLRHHLFAGQAKALGGCLVIGPTFRTNA